MRKWKWMLLAVLMIMCIAGSTGLQAAAESKPLKEWASAYLKIARKCNQEDEKAYAKSSRLFRSHYKYNLVFLDKDNVPELVVDQPGYWISVYTYDPKMEKTVLLMEHWGYGAMGNVGYSYLPKKNIIYNKNNDNAGAVVRHNIWTIEKGAVIRKYPKGISEKYYIDKNKNGYADEGEYTSKPRYYYGDRKISEKKFKSYMPQGTYESMMGNYLFSKLKKRLESEEAENSAAEKPAASAVQKTVACEKVTLKKTSVTLKTGKTYTLKPVIKPKACTQKIKYSSSDKKVATVSGKGKITAKKKGKATITVKVGKKKVKCKVTVVSNSKASQPAKAAPDVSKVMNKKLKAAARELGFKHVAGMDQEKRIAIGSGNWVKSTDMTYTADGTFSSSKSYIIGTSYYEAETGKWSAIIRDNTLTVFGVKIKMTADESDKRLKENGWSLSYDGINSRPDAYEVSRMYYQKNQKDSTAVINIDFKNKKICKISYLWRMESEFG